MWSFCCGSRESPRGVVFDDLVAYQEVKKSANRPISPALPCRPAVCCKRHDLAVLCPGYGIERSKQMFITALRIRLGDNGHIIRIDANDFEFAGLKLCF